MLKAVSNSGGGGGGSGTVTSVSIATANGVSGTVANPTTTPAITVALGAITPSSVAATGNVTGANLSGTNTGDQTQANIIPQTTFASLPSASGNNNKIYLVTDIGSGGTLFISNGTIWRPTNGRAVIAGSSTQVSHTGDTSLFTLASVSLPAGIMTAGGALEIDTQWSCTNNANTKTGKITFGGTDYLNNSMANFAAVRAIQRVFNTGSVSAQKGFLSNSTAYGNTASAVTTSAVNTANAVTLAITGQLGTSTDTISLDFYSVTLIIP